MIVSNRPKETNYQAATILKKHKKIVFAIFAEVKEGRGDGGEGEERGGDGSQGEIAALVHS